MDEIFCGSDFWNWNLTWNTPNNPDFTPCFERSVIANFPCAFLWIFAIIDIYHSNHSNSTREIPWGPLNITKVTLSTFLIILECGMLVVNRVVMDLPYPVDLYVPAIRATTLMLCTGLLLYSKTKGVRSSGVQFLFWLLLVFTQAIRFRSVLLQTTTTTLSGTDKPDVITFVIEMIYFPVVVGQLVLHCWADFIPQDNYQGPSSTGGYNGDKMKPSPERNCSFLSKILFEWYTPLAFIGYRKPLEISDLWDLESDIKSEKSVSSFDRYWPYDLNGNQKGKEATTEEESEKTGKFKNEGKSKIRMKTKAGVLNTIVKAFGIQYSTGLMMKVVTDLMVFVSPLILNSLITFVESKDEPTWKGILYSSLLLINALVGTLISTNGIHILYNTVVKIKSSLVSAVYRKTLLLSPSSKRGQSSGEILNRMAVDAQLISDFSQSAYLVVTTPLIIGVSIYFLWRILGWSAFMGLGILVVMIPINGVIAGRIQRLQKERMGFKDKRVKGISEMLHGIKCLKLNAWEPIFEERINQIRKEELKVMKGLAWWNALSNFLWGCSPFLVAVGTFGIFILSDEDNVLDANTAFVSLALFNIMGFPISTLSIIIPNFVQASVSLKRLNDFLVNSEEIDFTSVSHSNSEKDPIIIENASFAWNPKETEGDNIDKPKIETISLMDQNTNDVVTLKYINLLVKEGQLVAIVGPVGCGKSSLLSVLLNELPMTTSSLGQGGRVNVHGSIAYVAQQAWIQNATIRNNILFGKPYNSQKYKKVIKACCLLPDLAILPAGDHTEIGEKGINLSGGQKQRVSLARAVYNDADIYLLDDPLSAVDAHVGKHIFNKCLGPKGLLQKKTRILVTHGVVYLPQMDNIVVMVNGRISETGSYQELEGKKGGAFAEFLRQHQTSSSSSAEECSKTLDDLENEINVSSSSSSLESEKHEEEKIIQAEKVETEQVKSSVYLNYFEASGWPLILCTFLSYFLFQVFSVGANLWLSDWTTIAPRNINVTQIEDIRSRNYFYLEIYSAFGLFQGLTILFASIAFPLAALRASEILHCKMLQSMLRAPLQFFDVTPMGRILNRFSKDVESLDYVLPAYMRLLISWLFNIFAVFMVISWTTPVFAVVILPVSLVYYFIQRFYVCTSRQLRRLESVTRSPVFSHFGETINGASTIRAYGQQARFILEEEKRQDINMRVYYCSVTSNRWLQVRLDGVGHLVVFFAALLAVLGRDGLSGGFVGLSVSYALQVTNVLMVLVRYMSEVESNIVSVERIKEYMDGCPEEGDWKISGERGEEEGDRWMEGGGGGEVVFENYGTRYREGLDLVLRGMSCRIRGGEKVGIVGRTGAGKSSVTLALFRILEGVEGRIEVDGRDIGRVGLHDLRGRIGIIPQEPTLFSGTLRMNLDPRGKEEEGKGDEEIWRALEGAHLKEWLEGVDGGLEYEIVEGGENLSVGQRQLVCLARALLRKTKILVLDEATSAVDLETEEIIQDTIRREFRDATVITIAHRLNTIMDSDRVIVMENGKIKEFDTPQNLLANNQSMFYSLAKEAGIDSGTKDRD